MSGLWLHLYPPSWRHKYGADIELDLRATPTAPSTVLDMVRGAIDAWLHRELASGFRTAGARPSMWRGSSTVAALLLVALTLGVGGTVGGREGRPVRAAGSAGSMVKVLLLGNQQTATCQGRGSSRVCAVTVKLPRRSAARSRLQAVQPMVRASFQRSPTASLETRPAT